MSMYKRRDVAYSETGGGIDLGKKKKEHIVFDQMERVRKRVNIRFFNNKPAKESKTDGYNPKDLKG